MDAFTASAVALLSRYSNNLLKEDAESALSGKAIGDDRETAKIIQNICTFIDSFDEEEYLVRGIYRTSGSLAAQQNALNIIENAQGTPLKLYFIYELSPEDKASCIKTLLRKMPDTLFPKCQRSAILDISDVAMQLDQNGANENAFRALQILVYFIPVDHKRCLESLLTHLAAVAAHSEQNRMDVTNLALLFSSYIFPVAKDHNNMEEAKEEIERFGRLFPMLLRHPEQLFQLSDELLQTLDASLMKQAIDQNLNTSDSRFSSPYLNTSTGKVEYCIWSGQTPRKNGKPQTYQSTPTTQISRMTPIKNDSRDDPEVVMVQSCSDRVHTPRRSTTELEMAKLQANIASMADGPTRKKLLKKIQSEQRQKLGIRQGKSAILKRAFTPRK